MLTNGELFSKNSNLCDHNSPTSQTDRRTDGQTDGNTALCTIDVINVKKIIINVNKRVYSEKIVNVCKLEANVHKA